MNRKLAAGMAALGVLLGQPLLAQAPSDVEVLDELETVLVIGEQPGPGLWKVSKGDHVMWVLGTYGPLPKGMVWQSQKVEARIAESQEVLYPGSVDIGADIGILRGLTLIPAALKAGKIPDGKTLKDVLVPETYAKWLVLRKKYIGKDDDVEKWRPSLALESLRGEAMRKSGLNGPGVMAVVARASKKHKVRRNQLPAVKRTVKVENPRGMLKSVQQVELPDVECFTRGLDLVEPDVERMKALANAWSRGDIEKLRDLHRNVEVKDAVKDFCAYSLMAAVNEGNTKDATHAKKMMEDLLWHGEQAGVQARQEWLVAAQNALEKNRSTFAVLPLSEVFRPDGGVEKLRALGYMVEDPQ